MPEIAFTVLDPPGQHFPQAFDGATVVGDAIMVLVMRLGLPTELSYRLVPDGAAEGLLIDRTLAESGVRTDALLRLAPDRDDVFDDVTEKLSEEADEFATKGLRRLARERLDLLRRLDPERPGLAELQQRIDAPPARAEPQAKRGGCLGVFLIVAAAAAVACL